MNRFLAQAPPWRTASLYPRKLPDIGHSRPLQYATESDAAYVQRCYRWHVWLDHELNRELLGGPPMSYASVDEILAWRAWVDYLRADGVLAAQS